MEFINTSELVKDLSFGDNARDRIIAGVEKLTNAVKSTLGASGKCVIYEDAAGRPVITKDGVTVAESVVLREPVENMGATLIKEAAKNTVKEAGDGTTTATVLAHSLLKKLNNYKGEESTRELKRGVESGLEKVMAYLDKTSIPVEGEMLKQVAIISCNNDRDLGQKIGDAYKRVGKNGVVLMEESETNETHVEVVEGVQLDVGLKSKFLATDESKTSAILEDAYVLLVDSPIPNIRRIQSVLEFAVEKRKPLLIIASVEAQPLATLIANKAKGNIKVNIIDPPGFGPTRRDTMEDVAFLTGAKLMSEELGDDLDLISPDVLGYVKKAVTDDKSTVLQIADLGNELKERIDNVNAAIKNEDNPFIKRKLEQRLAMLNGKVAVIKVGGNSKVELKEKKDRVEDAIYAVKAALKEGIIPGGGIALLNASEKIKTKAIGEELLMRSIEAPYHTILENAGLHTDFKFKRKGQGVNVVNGHVMDMVKAGIIDPVLVTKTALKNAVSVVLTIISADCVINNTRVEDASN